MSSFKSYWRSIAKESLVKARVRAETVGFIVFVIGGLIALEFINFPADKIIWWSVVAAFILALFVEICFITPYKDKIVKIRSVDLLHEKVGTNPIAKGGGAAGLLLFKTNSISYECLVAARPVITLHFRDVFGREYSARQEGQGIARPEHIPGL